MIVICSSCRTMIAEVSPLSLKECKFQQCDPCGDAVRRRGPGAPLSIRNDAERQKLDWRNKAEYFQTNCRPELAEIARAIAACLSMLIVAIDRATEKKGDHHGS